MTWWKRGIVTAVVLALWGSAPCWAEPSLMLGDTRMDLDGYLRVRGYAFMLDGPDTQYGDLRLRLENRWTIVPGVRLVAEVNGLANTVFGENDGTGYLFTQTTGTEAHGRPFAYLTYEPVDSFELERLWMEVDLPFGFFQAGRMPLHWGLGILRNDGTGEHDDYGDTADRITWRSLPLGGTYSPWTIGAGYTRVATGPRALSPTNQHEVELTAHYKTSLTDAGALVAYRHQESDARAIGMVDGLDLLTADLYARQKFGPLWAEGEAYYVTGVFDFHPAGYSVSEVRGKAWGLLTRFGASLSRWEPYVEYGLNSGPDRSDLKMDQSRRGWTGGSFGQYGFAPDATVDRLMFREFFAAATAATASPFDDSFGSVANAQYIKLAASFFFNDRHGQVKLSFLHGEVLETGLYETFGDSVAVHRNLGWEVNAELWTTLPDLAVGELKGGLIAGFFAPGAFFEDLALYNGDDASPTGGVTWFDNQGAATLQTTLHWLL